MGTQLPLSRRCTAPPSIFNPYLFRPNGWVDQDVTWYGGKPRPRQRCIRWGRSSRLRGAQPPVFSLCVLWPNGWTDEDATWYGSRLGPGHIVLDGDPVLPCERGSAALLFFGPCLLWRSPISATSELLLFLVLIFRLHCSTTHVDAAYCYRQ